MLKKFKFICCSALCFSNLGVVTTNVVNHKFNEIKVETKAWDDSSYVYHSKFSKNGEIYKIYTVSDNNINKGYFILNNDDELVTFYIGDFENSILNQYNKLSPIFSDEGDLIEEDNISLVSNATTIEYHNPPSLNVNLYKTESSSMHSEQLIKDCPYYYNSPFISINNGCAPIAGTMLISFYDRYSNLSNLIDGLLPLNHEDDTESVNKIINRLAGYMDHKDEGTTVWKAIAGIDYYFYIKGYQNYKLYELDDYNKYSYFINNYKNPTYLRIKITNSDINHAVLGVGCANLKDSGRFMVTHYGWSDRNKGNYYVSENYYLGAYYIGEC